MKLSIFEIIKTQFEEIAPLDSTFKIELLEQVIYIDGTNGKNVVSEKDEEAQCTIKTTEEVLHKLRSGEINPMAAAMEGKIIIQGEMGLAMKLQSLLSKD